MIFPLKRGRVIQIGVAILTYFATFFFGLYSGWTSPMATYYSSADTKLQSGPMTTEEISLMSSLMFVGAILGGLLSGWLVNKIGRKWTILIWLFPQIPANILILLAESPLLLLVSRTLCGTMIGAALVVPSIFIAEIVEDNLKTTTGTFSGIMFNCGIFFSKLITGLYGIYAVPVASFPLIAIFIVCLMLCPDTPGYLLFCKKVNEAEKALRFYRGVSPDEQLPEATVLEFEEMKKQINLRSESTSISLKDFDATTILAIVVSFILTSTLNFAGIRITTSFSEVLIKDSGIEVDLALVDTSISSLLIIGCLISTYIVQQIGIRLPLLIYFTIGFVALLGTAVHYYLHHSYDLDLNSITWSFLIFLTIATVVPSTCLNNLCLIVPSMILPLKIRGSILGLCCVASLAFAVFLMHYYLYFVEAFGNSTILMAFSFWCLFGGIFTYFYIPEVSKKTYGEIVSLLNEKLPRRFRGSFP